MSIGMLMLTVVAVLVFFGVLQRVLDRMHLTDRQALALIAAMFVGTMLPNVDLGMVSISIGGAVIPLGVCVYLWCSADQSKERIRSLTGAVLTGAAVFGLSMLLPDEPEEMWIEPQLVYGAAGGVIAWILGRSRRGAFISGCVGVLIADVVTALFNWRKGIDQQLVLGGAGIADTVIISGVIAVLLAEAVGELVEKCVRRRKRGSGK